MNTTLQIRIDRKTKTEAKKIFKNLGIDMSSGVKLFLSRVVNTGAIPFIPVTRNGFTQGYEKKLLKEAEEAKKYGKRYNSIKELHADILK